MDGCTGTCVRQSESDWRSPIKATGRVVDPNRYSTSTPFAFAVCVAIASISAGERQS